MKLPRLLTSPFFIGIILGICLGLYFVMVLKSQVRGETLGYYLNVFIPGVVFMAITVPLIVAAIRAGKGLAYKRHAAGVILGVGLGLLFVSTVALMLRVILIYFIVYSFGMIVVLPIAAGIYLGIMVAKRWSPPELSWPVLLLIAAVLWPVLLALPFEVRSFQLRLSTPGIIPVYPESQRIDVIANLGDNEESSDSVTLTFMAKAESADVVDFYKDQLARQGWQEGPVNFIKWRRGDTPYWFEKNNQTIHLKVFGSEHDGKLLFKVIYNPGNLFSGVDMIAMVTFGLIAPLLIVWLLLHIRKRKRIFEVTH